ncbi:S-layer homology domain-containing protein [Egicoccus sp. AB-alg2]|uniref:S-layer homology domain-containing protein n=1 Tax=Egicoccus sp. AB-alg2 TaxID=3242693 RepID=UPI00359E86F3
MRSLFVRALLVALVLAIAPPASQLEFVSIPEVVREDIAVRVSADALVLSSGGAEEPEAHTSEPIAAPIPFTMVGFRLPDGVDTVRVRTAGDDGTWSEWYDLERVEPDEGPDPDSEEAANDQSRQWTEPAFVGESTRFQVEVPADELQAAGGDVEVGASVMDTEGLSGGPVSRKAVTVEGPVAEASNAPRVITRSQWGARPYSGSPSVSSNVDLVVVHHTAGSNNYTQAQAAGIVRGIQNWHMDNNRWSDIGYNMLVDRFGNLYEGRQGGVERGVVGAHASGYNTGSFGISVMGNYVSVDAPQAAYETMVNAIAWKAKIHGFNPNGSTTRTRNGVAVRTVTGHRDVGNTSCPGLISNRMGWIRQQAAARAPGMPGASSSSAPAPSRFPDVTSDNVHRANVLKVHDANVLLGYQDNTFQPDAALNRGDMARAVAVSMGLRPAQNWQGRFSDLDDVPWLAPWIVALADRGVVDGFPDGTFRPRHTLKRDQMATFIANAKGLAPRAPMNFTDVPKSNPHYHNIGAIERAGITEGRTPTRYAPRGTMRRDQSATLLVRAFDIK